MTENMLDKPGLLARLPSLPGLAGKRRARSGYSLLELLVVMAIIGILATGSVFMLSSASSRLKGAAFNMRNDFNLARSEAVNRNQNVLVDFVFNSGGRDGYRLCVDNNGNGFCDAGDTAIKPQDITEAVLFDQTVQFYDPNAAQPNRPTTTSGGANIIGQDGVLFPPDPLNPNSFTMRPDGTSNRAGTVVIYAPSGDPIKGDPYAVVVAPSTGRVRLEHWDRTGAGAWTTK